MKLVAAIVEKRLELGENYYLYRFLAPEIAAAAKPGQFIEIKASENEALDPFLARPISIYRIDREQGAIEVIFKTVGRGTRRIATAEPGKVINIFGPVGNGFEIPSTIQRVALIAGGIGMPPLFGLAELTHKKYDFTLFYGGRSSADLLELDKWAALNIPVRIATDDGSQGEKGVVTTSYATELIADNFDYIAACGPKPMLRAVQQLAKDTGIRAALSLESYMACGVGACLGCICKTTSGYKRVCVDGPIFAADEVIFDD